MNEKREGRVRLNIEFNVTFERMAARWLTVDLYIIKLCYTANESASEPELLDNNGPAKRRISSYIE